MAEWVTVVVAPLALWWLFSQFRKVRRFEKLLESWGFDMRFRFSDLIFFASLPHHVKTFFTKVDFYEQERLRVGNQQLRENPDEGADVPDWMGGRSVTRSE